MNPLDRWRTSCFDENNNIYPFFIDDEKCIDAKSILNGGDGQDSTEHAVKIHLSNMQRNIIESLLLSEDCDNEEVSNVTGVDFETIEVYEHLFFRDVFLSKIDRIDYIETGISYYADVDEEMLNSFLLKRWTLSLGKEYVLWKFRLSSTEYAPFSLYSTILKEAFFYHKEKAMGNTEVPLTEYLRSTNSLLAGIKSSSSIKDDSKDDSATDILKELGIIVKEVPPTMIPISEMEDEELINNATQQG